MYLEGFPFWNSKFILREFPSRYQTSYHLLSPTYQTIRTVIILFSVYVPSVHAHKSSSDEPLYYL